MRLHLHPLSFALGAAVAVGWTWALDAGVGELLRSALHPVGLM